MVLDIKNKQLHQQEKMMMELDKLVREGASSQSIVQWWEGGPVTLNLCFLFFVFFAPPSPEGQKCEAGREPHQGPAGERGPESPNGSSCHSVKVGANHMTSSTDLTLMRSRPKQFKRSSSSLLFLYCTLPVKDRSVVVVTVPLLHHRAS